jgi:hypothetical protein
VVVTVSGEAVNWATLTASTGSTIGYPMPPKPLKGQHKPPCIEGTEVEINGGCWVTLERRASCPQGYAEHQGKCYMPVRDPPPEPRSIQLDAKGGRGESAAGRAQRESRYSPSEVLR